MYYRILLLPLILLAFRDCDAQKTEAPIECIEYYPAIRFIKEGPILLPGLVQDGKWDQLRNFIENWKRSDMPSDELIFAISALSSIENKDFSIFQLPCDLFYFLEDYARELRDIDGDSPKFKYYLHVTRTYWYDASPDARQFLLFTRSWARRLLAGGQAADTELFLCRVFAGEIAHPRSAFERDRKDYAALDGFQRNLDKYNSDWLISRRAHRTAVFALTTGSWLPTGSLRTLGAHPAVGTILGGRNIRNEYDFVCDFRFPSPTPRYYKVISSDSLYNSDYYDGGYVGFDYTRYIVHKARFEWGLTSAMGYDYFDFVNGSGSNASVPPVGSFDFSNGFRVKYFYHRETYIGLSAKYHLIHYSTNGGTDLSGNAFSIDLLYGYR